MYGIRCRPQEGATELGMTLGNTGEGGSGCVDIGVLIPGHSALNTGFCIRDMDVDPLHQEDPGGVTPLVSMAYYR